MEAALHITIQGAGEPEALGKVVGEAMAYAESVRKPEVKTLVPEGYRCFECYSDNGGHTPNCSVGAAVTQRKLREKSE